VVKLGSGGQILKKVKKKKGKKQGGEYFGSFWKYLSMSSSRAFSPFFSKKEVNQLI